MQPSQQRLATDDDGTPEGTHSPTRRTWRGVVAVGLAAVTAAVAIGTTVESLGAYCSTVDTSDVRSLEAMRRTVAGTGTTTSPMPESDATVATAASIAGAGGDWGMARPQVCVRPRHGWVEPDRATGSPDTTGTAAPTAALERRAQAPPITSGSDGPYRVAVFALS